MAAITGFGEFSISPMISGRLGGCDGLLNSVMSAPAMKVRPAPTSTIARVAASPRACVSVLNRPARTTCLSALTGGLSTVMTAISPSFCKPTSVVTGSHPPRWCDSDRRSAESIFARGAGAFHSGTSSNSAVRKLILQFDGNASTRNHWCRETCFKSFLVDLGFGPGERVGAFIIVPDEGVDMGTQLNGSVEGDPGRRLVCQDGEPNQDAVHASLNHDSAFRIGNLSGNVHRSRHAVGRVQGDAGFRTRWPNCARSSRLPALSSTACVPSTRNAMTLNLCAHRSF